MMQMVILAGGIGTRMRPLTEGRPKAMIMVGDRPFLEHQIELLRKNRITEIVLCVGYLAHHIKAYFGNGSGFGVDISYSEERGELLGMAGALKKAEPLLAEEFLAINGDSYLLLDYAAIMSRFRQRDELGLMVIYRNHDRQRASNVAIDGELVTIYDSNKRSPEMTHIDAGLWALRKRALSLIPPRCPVSQGQFFHKLIERNQLLAFEVSQRFYEIGSFNGLAEFEQLIQGGTTR